MIIFIFKALNNVYKKKKIIFYDDIKLQQLYEDNEKESKIVGKKEENIYMCICERFSSSYRLYELAISLEKSFNTRMNIGSKFPIYLFTLSTSRFVTIFYLYSKIFFVTFFIILCVFYSTKRTTNSNEVYERELNKLECPQALVFVFSHLLACSID
jgi:hypothetical protein